jgi:hypothetical protein
MGKIWSLDRRIIKEHTMKRLLIIALLLIAVPAGAADWTLSWNASTGAAGYEVSYKPLAASTYTVADVATATSWVLPVTLVKGTRYEFFVRAYTAAPKSYSGDSDHLRFTYPKDPLVIEMPANPNQIIIEFK